MALPRRRLRGGARRRARERRAGDRRGAAPGLARDDRRLRPPPGVLRHADRARRRRVLPRGRPDRGGLLWPRARRVSSLRRPWSTRWSERLKHLRAAAQARGRRRPAARAAIERHHAKGKLTARERIEYLLDEDSFLELDMLNRHHALGHGPRGHAALHRRRDHRLRHDRRSQGLRLLPGLHRLRRRAGRDPRREDPQDHGPGHDDGPADHRPQRRRRRADPRGRGRAARLRRDLPAQRARLGRRAPDLGDPRALRGRRGLLAGADRLHLHGEGHQPHVHHRARRGQDRHRRGRDPRRAGRRADPRHQVGRGQLRHARREERASTRCATCSRSCRRTTSRSRRAS